MTAYVLISTRTGEERMVERSLRGQPGIRYVRYTFGVYDVMAEIEAPDLAGLAKLVSATIRATPGVEDTLTCIAVD